LKWESLRKKAEKRLRILDAAMSLADLSEPQPAMQDNESPAPTLAAY
jgi:hypothetical protein